MVQIRVTEGQKLHKQPCSWLPKGAPIPAQMLTDLTRGPFALAPTLSRLGEAPAAVAKHVSTTDACVPCGEAQERGPWQR